MFLFTMDTTSEQDLVRGVGATNFKRVQNKDDFFVMVSFVEGVV